MDIRKGPRKQVRKVRKASPKDVQDWTAFLRKVFNKVVPFKMQSATRRQNNAIHDPLACIGPANLKSNSGNRTVAKNTREWVGSWRLDSNESHSMTITKGPPPPMAAHSRPKLGLERTIEVKEQKLQTFAPFFATSAGICYFCFTPVILAVRLPVGKRKNRRNKRRHTMSAMQSKYLL